MLGVADAARGGIVCFGPGKDVGPEVPLVLGVADAARGGIVCFGPGKDVSADLPLRGRIPLDRKAFARPSSPSAAVLDSVLRRLSEARDAP